MRRGIRNTWMIAACLVLAFRGASRADLVLAFTQDATPITFSVLVGQTVLVPVYLVERNQAPFTSTLSDEGLFSAGVRLNYGNATGTATVVTSGAVLNPGFNTNTSGFPIINNGLGFSAVSGATTSSAGVPASGNPAYVLVGTFTFQGNLAGNVTTVTTAKPQSAAFPEFLSNDTGTVLELENYANIFYAAGDPANPISYSTTITTISAVPEPATYLMLVLATVGYSLMTCFGRTRNKTDNDSLTDTYPE